MRFYIDANGRTVADHGLGAHYAGALGVKGGGGGAFVAQQQTANTSLYQPPQAPACPTYQGTAAAPYAAAAAQACVARGLAYVPFAWPGPGAPPAGWPGNKADCYWCVPQPGSPGSVPATFATPAGACPPPGYPQHTQDTGASCCIPSGCVSSSPGVLEVVTCEKTVTVWEKVGDDVVPSSKTQTKTFKGKKCPDGWVTPSKSEF